MFPIVGSQKIEGGPLDGIPLIAKGMVIGSERLSVVGPLTLAIIVLLLYVNFRRFDEVAIIIGTLPMALVGGIWLLYLLDYQLSVAVGVGFIALAGVAVEIGVVVCARS